MRQLAIVPILLFVSCGTGGVRETSSRPQPSATDVSIAQSLRDLEEAADRVITQIHWDAADRNIRAIGDGLAHSHDERIERLKVFIGQYGRAAPAAAEARTRCFTEDAPGTPLTPVDDFTLIDRLLLHHDCGQSQARLLEKSRSDAAQALALDLLKSYDADVRLVHTVKGVQ